MGWTGGSELAEDVWDLLREFVPAKKRKNVARALVELFEQQDCDTMHECEQLYYEDAELGDDEDDEDEDGICFIPDDDDADLPPDDDGLN